MKYGDGYDFSGLLKIANLSAFSKEPTVGDAMNAMNANIYMNPVYRRDMLDSINRAGLDVKEPASRIPSVVGGALAGYYGMNALGANRFWRNVGGVAGALYGNHLFNASHPDPNRRGPFTFNTY